MDISLDVSLWEFAALAAAALLVGFSKTAVSGANTVSLAVFAAVLPARDSTGVLLPILIAGDVLAVLTYRRHAHWPTLWRLFPAVAGGVVVGTVFLMWAGDAAVRTSIGAILLLMAAVTVWR
ncbi:TSUP family transporter, partial [Streptomyces sp. NPDC059900]